MRNGPRRIDEFKIARVFGAIAAVVALYGVALSAAALVEEPGITGERSPKWYEHAEPVINKASDSTIDGVRGRSFWTPAAPHLPAPQSSVADASPRVGSFWAKPDEAGPIAPWQLARNAGNTGNRF